MDTLFHFVFAFIAGMAVNVKLDHRPMMVAGVALSAVLIDIDHLFFAYPRALHSLFVTALVPLLLFYAAYRYENGTDSIRYQSLSLLLFVMLIGHVVADLFNGGAIKLFYPLSTATFTAPSWTVTVFAPQWELVSPDGVALAIYGGIIALAYYAEEFIFLVEKKQEAFGKALRHLQRV